MYGALVTLNRIKCECECDRQKIAVRAQVRAKQRLECDYACAASKNFSQPNI